MSRSRLTALATALALLTGCLTPEMGHSLEARLDLIGPTAAVHRTPGTLGGPLDRDVDLPARIWYFDAIARIYHERRTNTFFVTEGGHGWVAVTQTEAFREDFHVERATIQVDGAPPDVENCLDALQRLDPDWRGA